METVGERIRRLRTENKMKQHDIITSFASMGVIIDRITISRWENGKQEPTLTFLKAYAKLFGKSLDFIVDGVGSKSNSTAVQIPLLGTIAAGLPIYAEQFVEAHLSVPSTWSVDYALKVKGESMIDAGIPNGSVVLCRKQDDVNDGEIAVCIVDGEEATLKRIRRYGNILVLHPENKSYSDIVFEGKDKNNVKIIGKAKKVLLDVL